jgi:hypothetical protein
VSAGAGLIGAGPNGVAAVRADASGRPRPRAGPSARGDGPPAGGGRAVGCTATWMSRANRWRPSTRAMGAPGPGPWRPQPAPVSAFRATMLGGVPPVAGPVALLTQSGPVTAAPFGQPVATPARTLGRRPFQVPARAPGCSVPPLTGMLRPRPPDRRACLLPEPDPSCRGLAEFARRRWPPAGAPVLPRGHRTVVAWLKRRAWVPLGKSTGGVRLSGPRHKYSRIRVVPGGAWLRPRRLAQRCCAAPPASSPPTRQCRLSVRPYLWRRPLSR